MSSDSGIQKLLNDLGALKAALTSMVGDGSALKQLNSQAYTSVSNTVADVSNTIVGISKTVAGNTATVAGGTETAAGANVSLQALYGQFQAVSVGWSAFKWEIPTIHEIIADRKSRLETGGTSKFKVITGGLTVKEAADKKLEDTWKAVFPNGFGSKNYFDELIEEFDHQLGNLGGKSVGTNLEATNRRVETLETKLAEARKKYAEKMQTPIPPNSKGKPRSEKTVPYAREEIARLAGAVQDLATAIG